LITAIVLSDDSAARTHLLLESLLANSGNLFDVTVLYKYSDENFFEGYSKAAEHFYSKNKYGHAFPIKWMEREHLEISKDLSFCLKSSRDIVCLFNDENILFTRPPSYQSIKTLFNDFDLLSLSLRLGNNTVIQNPYESNNYFAELPSEGEFVLDEFLVWDSSKVTPYTNFAIPFSTNGHCYKRSTLDKIMTHSSESRIDALEEELQPLIYEELYKNLSRMMACPEFSVVIHNSSKKISEAVRTGLGMEKVDINLRYLEGKRIDLDYFSFSSISKPYEDFVIRFR